MKPILLAIAAASILVLPAHSVRQNAKHILPKQPTIVKVPLPEKKIDCDSRPVSTGKTNSEHFLHDIFFAVKF